MNSDRSTPAENANLQELLAIALSFAAGALLPILPYFFDAAATFTVPISLAYPRSLVLDRILFGDAKQSHPIRKGLEIVAFGALVFE